MNHEEALRQYNESVQDYLERIRRSLRIKRRYEFASMIGVSPQVMSNWMRRDSLPPSNYRQIVDFAKKFKVSEPCVEYVADVPQILEGVVATCGDVDRNEAKEKFRPVTAILVGIKYVLKCHGESMEPLIHDGDYVGVGDVMGRYEEFKPGAIYLIVTRSCTMVKMVEDPGAECPYLQLSTVNPDYHLSDDGHLPKDEVIRTYRVIKIVREL